MTGSIPPPNALAYEGQVVVPFITRTFNPQTTFNTFPVPTIWINTSSSMAYILVSKALGYAVWATIGGSPGNIDTITTPDSTVVVPTAGNINFLNGTGVTITGSGSNITFNSTGGGLSWTNVTVATSSLAPGMGYTADNSGGVSFTLPTTCPYGSVFAISAVNAAGWSIAQNALQEIFIGKVHTTIGTGGSVSSNYIGDKIVLLCTVANTSFQAIDYSADITYV